LGDEDPRFASHSVVSVMCATDAVMPDEKGKRASAGQSERRDGVSLACDTPYGDDEMRKESVSSGARRGPEREGESDSPPSFFSARLFLAKHCGLSLSWRVFAPALGAGEEEEGLTLSRALD